MKTFSRILKTAGLMLLLSSMAFLSQEKTGLAQQSTKIEAIHFADGNPIQIEIARGLITRIIRKSSLDDPSKATVFVAPGLIDSQVNGYLSVNFASPGLTLEGIRTATQGLWKAGVTTYLPTVTTNTHELFLANFRVLASALTDPEIGASIPGFHLEGPYISPEDGYRGAHTREWVRPPNWKEFQEINAAANNKIIEVTLAPEMEGAMEFIAHCAKAGIVVGLGHHNASAAVIQQAVDNGAAISTHLGNGCANVIHRHLNPLWPQLAEDRLMASLIVDGFHLRPEQVRVFYRTKGPGRILLTSDVTKLAGMPPGEYDYEGRKVVLTPQGMARLPEQDVLAGAALPITAGVSNIMRFTGCSLSEAIQMATQNPAQLYGLRDRGEIRVGRRADLILFTLNQGDMQIHQTLLAGKSVYRAP